MTGAIFRPPSETWPYNTNINPNPIPNYNYNPRTENSLQQIQLSVPGDGKYNLQGGHKFGWKNSRLFKDIQVRFQDLFQWRFTVMQAY